MAEKNTIRLLVLGNHPLMGDWLDYYTGAIKERIEVAGHIGAERWAKAMDIWWWIWSNGI